MRSLLSRIFSSSKAETPLLLSLADLADPLARVLPALVASGAIKRATERDFLAFLQGTWRGASLIRGYNDGASQRIALALDDTLVLLAEPVLDLQLGSIVDLELPDESRALYEVRRGNAERIPADGVCKLYPVRDRQPLAVDCHVCSGSGKVACQRCEGKGWFRGRSGKKLVCKSEGCRRGFKPCYYCKGAARLPCGIVRQHGALRVKLPHAREGRRSTTIYLEDRPLSSGQSPLFSPQAAGPPLQPRQARGAADDALSAGERALHAQLDEMEAFLALELEAASAELDSVHVFSGKAAEAGGRQLLSYSIASGAQIRWSKRERLLLTKETGSGLLASRSHIQVRLESWSPGELQLRLVETGGNKVPRQGVIVSESGLHTVTAQLRAIESWRSTDLLRSPIKRALALPETVSLPPSPAVERVFDPLIAGNQGQRAALERALSRAPICLIQGPPGTGKTSVIVEILRQELKKGSKVLVTSQSNLAVDNILERLDALGGMRLLRIGAEERVQGNLHHLLLGSRRRSSPAPGGILRRLVGGLRAMLGGASGTAVRGPEAQIAAAQVIGATCIGSDHRLLRQTGAAGQLRELFDVVIVDEAGRSTPMETLVPLLLAPRAVLVGDHKQLPPTLSQEVRDLWSKRHPNVDIERSIGATSLFQLALATLPRECLTVLDRQFRMHPQIGSFIASVFYAEEQLTHGVSEAERSLPLPGFPAALSYHPTAAFGERRFERKAQRSASRENPAEATLVRTLLQRLDTEAGSRGHSVGVITFYSAQVELIRRELAGTKLSSLLFDPDEDVATLDSYQGKEKDVILLSLVRSTRDMAAADAAWFRFFLDVRRLNVALSRARKRLMIVGDLEQILLLERNKERYSGVSVLNDLYEYLRENRLIVPTERLLRGAV